MKQLDTKNSTARKKAGDRPYYKAVINYEKACPYCDELLQRGSIMDYECQCGIWSISWMKPNKWIYTKKPTNKGKEGV